MYGLAGYRHTPGMPYLDAFDAPPPMRKSKGVAGQRTLRNKESSERYKDNKHKMSKADQENMRRTSIMFRETKRGQKK
jgi:hypothetical protein